MSQKPQAKDTALPFYALPSRRKSTTEIIREAKAEVKSMAARRPVTPFTKSASMSDDASDNSRPSSSFSHVSYTSGPQSRPLSSVRLKPLRAKSAGHREAITAIHLEPTVIKTPLIDRKTGFRMRSYTAATVPAVDGCESSFIVPADAPSSHAALGSHAITEAAEVKATKVVDVPQSTSKKTKDKKEVDKSTEEKSEPCPTTTISLDKDNKLGKFEAEIQIFRNTLEKLVASGKRKNEGLIIEKVTKLNQLIEESQMFEKPFRNRVHLLKSLFHLLNYGHPMLGLRVSKLALQMNVCDKNLANVFKFLYKICHVEKNIIEFLECGILGPLIVSLKEITCETNLQALKYCISLVCLLSAKDLLLDVLGVFACHQVLLKHLKDINNIEIFNQNEEHSYIIIKIITALRYLSENDMVWQFLLQAETCEVLIDTLSMNEGSVEIVITNIRLLSKICDHDIGCDSLLAHNQLCDVLKRLVIDLHSQRFILLQVTHIIGTVISRKFETALHFSDDPELQNALCCYLEEYIVRIREAEVAKESVFRTKPKSSRDEGIEGGNELMMKVVRIFANMCLCPDIGYIVSEDKRLVTNLLNLICCLKVKIIAEVRTSLICILLCLNNITYFVTEDSGNMALYILITEEITSLLKGTYPSDVRTEACNVLQNLTRISQIRSFILKSNLIPTFVSLLEEHEHKIAVCGYAVIMNLLFDMATRAPFYNEQGFTKLLHKLHLCLCRDWKTGALLCQILWNYCTLSGPEEDGSGERPLKKPLADLEIQHLIKVLQYATGASAVLKTDEESSKKVWEEEFLPVAEKLLRLLQSLS